MAHHLKFTLQRIRLNNGGYDNTGTYYGHGQPLYEFQSENGDYGGTVRAPDREAAKQHVWKKVFEGAQFYR